MYNSVFEALEILLLCILDRLPLRFAMMNTYREDMATALEVLARRHGLFTSYEDVFASGPAKLSSQKNLARQKTVATDAFVRSISS